MNIKQHIELGKLALELGFFSLDTLSRALVELGQLRGKKPVLSADFWHHRGYLSAERLSIALAYRDTRKHQADSGGPPNKGKAGRSPHKKRTRAVAQAVARADALAETATATRSLESSETAPPSLSKILFTLGQGDNDPLRSLLGQSAQHRAHDLTFAEPTLDEAVEDLEELGIEEVDFVEGSKTKAEEISQPPWWPQLHRLDRNRYKLGKTLGQGGSAKVVRAFDREMGRTVAMKILLPPTSTDPLVARETLGRFIAEAQIIGQLEHPNIVPIYDMGSLDNGELYYTMREIRRHSLREVLEGLADAREKAAYEEYTIPRLMNIFRQVCQAVHYAHVSGVVHRDLKPDNIMLGDYGEVLVADWGLATVKGREVVTDFALNGGERRVPGQTLGTPAYMPPEQARGELDKVDELSDVYALGASLYEILTLTPPFLGATPLEVMTKAVDEELEPPSKRAPERGIHAELEAICIRSMLKSRKQRTQSAHILLQEIEAYLEGLQPREAAKRCHVASEHAATYFHALDAIQELKRRAEDAAEAVQPWESIERKRLVWHLQNEVQTATHQMATSFGDAIRSYTQALAYDPENLLAPQGLAQLYWSRFTIAEQKHNIIDQLYFGGLIRQYDDGSYLPMLEGNGSLHLTTVPSGAQVFIEDLVERERRRTPVRQRALGTSPAYRDQVAMGTYQLTITHPGYRTLRLPLRIDRCAKADMVVELLTEEAIGEEFVYVPAGEFLMGGDQEALGSVEASLPFVESFLVSQFPITFRQYLEFIRHLWAQDPEEARERLPRTRQGALCRFDATLKMYVPDNILIEGAARQRYPRGRGIEWSLPVVGVSLEDALAYTHWRSVQERVHYRLPTESEWEKAARGTDGRIFPWGNHFDPTFCKMRDSRPEQAQPEPVGIFQHDVSPYGARDCAGSVREWVADQSVFNVPIHPDAETCGVRGGAWDEESILCRLASRQRVVRFTRNTNLGFRIVRGL